MKTAEEARKRWLVEKTEFANFGKVLEKRIGVLLKPTGVWFDIHSRPKEMHSLIRKLLLKTHHTYESLPDKVGARVIVRYRSEVEKVLSIIRNEFVCTDPDDKRKALMREHKVGYISTHVDLRLKEADPASATYPPAQYVAEIQVRTLAQHLWAEMSHDTVYKNDLIKLPEEYVRRVDLMAGLIEVADMEFERLNAEYPNVPEIQLLKALERHFFKLTARRADTELSIEVITLLLPLYGRDLPAVIAHLEQFFATRESQLASIYSEYAQSETASAFLFQPEALMIYDRLIDDQIATRTTWNLRFPESELELLANTFGVSFD
jgi:ppGpp synthetase/RelA/SpoT-type nucleotidyltranferase